MREDGLSSICGFLNLRKLWSIQVKMSIGSWIHGRGTYKGNQDYRADWGLN